ncbi:MAG: hypothetical protein RIU67_2054, partial [Actinomycetota bacterium]
EFLDIPTSKKITTAIACILRSHASR